MIKFVTLIIGFWLFVCSPVEGQPRKLTLEEKITQDTILMNMMIRNLERGTENIGKLKEIDDKIRRIWTQSQDTIIIGERPFTEHIYAEAKDVIEEFLPDDAASLVRDIEELKLRYSQIKGDKKKYIQQYKIFEKLKKQYKKEGMSFGKKIKALLQIRRFMEKELNNESTDITGLLVAGGELLTIIDEYAVEMGMETLSYDDLVMLKDDPLEFLVIKAQRHLNNYKKGKEEFKYLKKKKDTLNDNLYQIEQLFFLTQTENKKLSEKNETIAANSKNEQQKLQQQLSILKYQLAEQQQLVQSLKNERNDISKEVNKLSNQRIMIVKDVDDKANEKQALSEATQALQDTINDKANLLLATKQDLTATKDALKLKQTTLESLAEERDTAEQGRMLFLISSIVLLSTLLIYMIYSQINTNTLNRQLEEKNQQLGFMLRELNHRTKNNLQIISSIVGMQAMNVEDKETKETLEDVKKRIHAIGLMHRGMYSTDFDKQVQVNMQTFIDDLTNSLKRAFQYGKIVSISKDIENIFILSDYAVPVGLIINEVITNAFKHAFSGHPDPELDIKFKHTREQKRLFLSIEDNGPGAKEWDGTECPYKANMGSILVKVLTKQLEGKYKYEKGKKGLRFVMTFPVNNALELN